MISEEEEMIDAVRKEMLESQTKNFGVANLKDDLSAEEAISDDGRK